MSAATSSEKRPVESMSEKSKRGIAYKLSVEVLQKGWYITFEPEESISEDLSLRVLIRRSQLA
jgi:hypothetical protein